MNSIRYFIIIISLTLLHSCGCDPSIEIGTFHLSNESRKYFVYDNEEVLEFVDQDGNGHQLRVRNEKTTQETKMIVRTLCDEGPFDQQYEYYKISREQISFEDELNRQVFYLDLKTHFEDDENIDSLGVYDWLLISASMPYQNGFRGITCNILTDVKQNKVSQNHRDNFVREAKFIGDTVLFGNSYEQVYQSVGSNDHRLYYSKTEGVVVIFMNENYYWALKT